MIAAFIFLGLLKGEHCFCETHYKKFNIYAPSFNIYI